MSHEEGHNENTGVTGITRDDINAWIADGLLLGQLVARRTKTKKDDLIVAALQKVFADGTLVDAIAEVIGVQ